MPPLRNEQIPCLALGNRHGWQEAGKQKLFLDPILGYDDQIPAETRFKASDFFVNRGDTH